MHATTRRTLLLASILAIPAMAIVLRFLQWPEHGLVLKSGSYLGVDFLNYWLGGRLAITGRAGELYDLGAYNRAAWAMFDPALQRHNFSYPPHILPLLTPFGALPYFAGLAAWNLAGFVAFSLAVLGRLPTRQDRPLLLLALLAPVALVNFVYGQIGLLMAGLLVGALQLLPRRPVAAGILIGVLTVKPQLGLLLPLLLVVERQWAAIASAAVTAAALALLSAGLWGLEPWLQYIREVVPLQHSLIATMAGRQYGLMVPSVYGGLVHAGVPVATALAIHWAAALAVALVAVRAMLAPAVWPLKAAIVATASVMLSPYILSYDLAVPLAALAWHLNASGAAVTPTGAIAIGLAWALPFGFVILASLFHLPLAPLVMLGLYGWLVAQALGWRLAREPAPVHAVRVA